MVVMDAQNLAELNALAAEKDSDKRRELLNRVTDLFFATPEDLRKAGDITLYADLVSQLLASARLEVREEYSMRISGRADAPHDIVMQLARDEHAVARPVLQHSPVLEEQEVAQLASVLSSEHRSAIAQRPNISVTVTDMLIRFNEPQTLELLLSNITAAISETGFETLVTKASADGRLDELISQRPDLPIQIAQRLERQLDRGVLAEMKQLAQTLSQATSPPVVDTGPDWTRRRIEIRAKAAEIGTDEAARDVFVRALAKSGSIDDVTLALAEFCGLPRQQVANVFEGYRALPLALLSRSVGLRKETYADLDQLRSRKARSEPLRRQVAMDMYMTLEKELAMRAMRFLKLRNGVSAKPA